MVNGSADNNGVLSSDGQTAGSGSLQSSIDDLKGAIGTLTSAVESGGAGGGGAPKGYTSNYLNGATGNFGGLMRNVGNGGQGANGGNSNWSMVKSVGSFGLGAFTGLGVRSATGFQSLGDVLNNTMQANQAMNSAVTWGGGYGQGFNSLGVGKAGFMGAQGSADYFTGQQMLQSLGGWTSGKQFQNMSSAIGGTQLLNPMLSNSQITSAVGGFASMSQTNQLKMYGIQTYSGGKFQGSIQNIAKQLMQKMGIDGTHLSAQQIAEEGGSNSPLGQQLQMMVSNGSLTSDQAEMVREQVLGNMQAQKSGSTVDAFNANQSAAASGSKAGQAALTKLGYGKGALSAVQSIQARGTQIDTKVATALGDSSQSLVKAFSSVTDAAMSVSDALMMASVGSAALGKIGGMLGKGALGKQLGGILGGALGLGGTDLLLGQLGLPSISNSLMGGTTGGAPSGAPGSPVAAPPAGAIGALVGTHNYGFGEGAGGAGGTVLEYCLQAVSQYLGAGGNLLAGLGMTSNARAWSIATQKGWAHPNDKNPPLNAVCIWLGGSGHAALGTGNGQNIVSPGWGSGGVTGNQWYATTIDSLRGLQYMGYFVVPGVGGKPVANPAHAPKPATAASASSMAHAIASSAASKSGVHSVISGSTAGGYGIVLNYYQTITVGSGATTDHAKTIGSQIATTSSQRIAALMGGK